MSKKIYVGNLPFSIKSNDLKELFLRFGDTEEVSVIEDRFSGRSKGFGFVTFKEDSSAQKAISEMNDKEVEGRKLVVNEAKPMEEMPKREFRPRRNNNFDGQRRSRY